MKAPNLDAATRQRNAGQLRLLTAEAEAALEARAPLPPVWSLPSTLADLADRFDVGRHTLARWLKAGLIPHVRLSRSMLMVDLNSCPQRVRATERLGVVRSSSAHFAAQKPGPGQSRGKLAWGRNDGFSIAR